MAITVKHKFVSAIPDGTDATVVRPSNWNDDHDLVGTVPVANGGTGVTTSSGADSVVLRDANQNIAVNAIDDGYINTVASGTPIVLTVSSVRRYTITGSGGQTFKLPNATTLVNGAIFEFDNNQSSGAITVNNNSNTLVVSVPSGGIVRVDLLSNSIAAGSWDRHDLTPANVSWSTNTFDYAGSITSATWNGNTVAVNRGGTGVTTSTGSGSNVLNTSPTLTTPAITGGTIDNTVIGATTPAAGTFTTITGQTEVLKGTGQNFLTQSSVLTNAAWSQGNVTVTGSQSDPLGGTTAILMDDGTANAQHLIQQNYTTANTLTYTYSFYAKAGTANYIGIGTYQSANYGIIVNLTNGTFSANITNAPASYAITSVGSGWYRCSITINSVQAASSAFYIIMSENGTSTSFTGTNKTVYVAAPQLEIGSTANTYIPTTTTAIYGTPTLSFSGVAGLGLESNGSLYVSPAGTGALQAQATTSTTVGGNARGTNAVDWQTTRSAATQVASAPVSVISGGFGNSATAYASGVSAGVGNLAQGNYNYIGGGANNTANGSFATTFSTVVGGYLNTGNGYYNFIGSGFTNSGTSASAVTTQSGTMNATTAVTLSGSNANIKVGQYITGTSIAQDTYVAAISGTALTLSKNASGSSTSTLSFFTPHGVVVGGGNNQATGSYSFIGGGGDAGTAANRNVASGDWSFVGGGFKNVASGKQSFIGNGDNGIAGGTFSSVLNGSISNQATGTYANILNGTYNIASGTYSTVINGSGGSTRGLSNYTVFAGIFGSAIGDTQTGLMVLKANTSDATATALTVNNSTAGSTNQVILPNNSAYFFTGEVVSGVTGGGNTKGWTIEGVIKRGANAGSTTLVGVTVTSMYADVGAATWTIGVTADTTNGGLAVTFTGQAATTIRTVCQIRTTEMTY
jgi:hypothetical protein